jgi:hypothetical protein
MRLSSFLVFALSLSACVTAAPPPVTPIEARGDWQHGGSGLWFPEQLAGFSRVNINQYQRQGTSPSVGVGYNAQTADAAVTFTVYVGPPVTQDNGQPASLELQFAMEKDSIRQRPTSVESSSRPVTLVRDGESLPGMMAEFLYIESFAQQVQPLVSQLYLVKSGEWFIKYRISFAVVQETEARALVDALLRAAPWGALSPGAQAQ